MAYGDNIFTGMIDENGVIWDMATGRKRQAIGIDAQKEQEYQHTITEMQETLDNYYAKLVELGVITPVKTPEQIAQEAAAEQVRIAQEQAAQQMEVNRALLDAVKSLKAEIGELRGNGFNKYGIEPCDKQSGCDSQSDRQIAVGGARSNKSSAKATA